MGSLSVDFVFVGNDDYDIGPGSVTATHSEGTALTVMFDSMSAPLSISDLLPGAYEVTASGEVQNASTPYYGWGDCEGSCTATEAVDIVAEQATSATLMWSCDVDCDDESNDYCFTAGTPVRTPRGDVPIESLRPGDPVFAIDERTGRAVIRPVADNHRRRAPARLDVVVDGQTIEVTPEHPFWAPDLQRWLPAGELQPGVRLLRPDAPLAEARVQSVATVPQPVDVFNLSVGGPEQTYLAHGVLVHNKTGRPDYGLTHTTDVMEWPVADGGNGHFYMAVYEPYLSWEEARTMADAAAYAGMTGHLLTVADDAELGFVTDELLAYLPYSVYIGGEQDVSHAAAPDEAWSWVTGEPWEAPAWADGEPNDGGTTPPVEEDGLQLWPTVAAYNDVPRALHPSDDIGYVVEFEPAYP